MRTATLILATALLFSCAAEQKQPAKQKTPAGQLPASQSEPIQQPTESTIPDQQTVYVTKTGAKYHRVGCRYLKKSKIAKKLSDAKVRYEPCKVCKPPI